MKRWRLVAILLAAVGAGAWLVWSSRDNDTWVITAEWRDESWSQKMDLREGTPYAVPPLFCRTVVVRSNRYDLHEMVLLVECRHPDFGGPRDGTTAPDVGAVESAEVSDGTWTALSYSDAERAISGTTRVLVCDQPLEEAKRRLRFNRTYPRLRWVGPVTWRAIEIPNDAHAGVPFPISDDIYLKR
jgi:hypothetical protein